MSPDSSSTTSSTPSTRLALAMLVPCAPIARPISSEETVNVSTIIPSARSLVSRRRFASS